MSAEATPLGDRKQHRRPASGRHAHIAIADNRGLHGQGKVLEIFVILKIWSILGVTVCHRKISSEF